MTKQFTNRHQWQTEDEPLPQPLHNNRSEEMEGNKPASWFHQLPTSPKTALKARIYRDEGKTQVDKEDTMAKLKMLRQLLFHEIMESEDPKPADRCSLKLAPKTLSEAVKALLDVDKRICEREGAQSATISDPYQNILARCAKMVEDG